MHSGYMLVLEKGHLEEVSAVHFSFLWLFTLPGLRKKAPMWS